MSGTPELPYLRRRRHPAVRPLAEVAAGFKAGTTSVSELFASFMAAALYLPRPPAPGVLTIEVEGGRLAPVFSSDVELARFAGAGEWFSTDGFDLVGMLAPGVTIGLDLAAPHCLRLDPAAVRLDKALFLPRPGNRRPPGVVGEEDELPQGRPGRAGHGGDPPARQRGRGRPGQGRP